MRKFAVISIALLSLLMIMNTTSAYTNSGGIEDGDEVNLNYTLTVDGVVKEQNDGAQFVISEDQLIEGFYEGIIGMKVGEDDQIIVPPEKGYDSGELEGKTLYFDVYINGIVKNIRGDDYEIDGGVGSTLRTIGGWVGVIGGGILAYFAYDTFINTVRVPACEHCKANGRNVKSEGTCKKCGNSYCRSSFIKGCPNCKANTLLPLSL